VYILMDPHSNWKASHQQIRLATNMKFAGVNIYGHPNIWCEDQHRLTTNNLFFLNWNRQFYIRPLAEEITIRFPAPSMTNGNNYEKTFALKLFGSHTTCIVISIQLQITYMWQIKVHLKWNISLIHSNTHEYALVVLSQWKTCGWAWGG
jgi:hypothetical protein